MNRSLRRTILLAVTAAAALSACTTFSDNEVAARVDETELSRDDFEAVLADFPVTEGSNQVLGTTSTQILSFWIQTQLLLDGIDAAGGEVTDADLARTRAELEAADASFATFSPTTQDLIVENQAATTVFQQQFVPTADELRATYVAGPDSGIVCSRHILVDTAAEAEAVVDRLDAGESFADVAAEVSTDPGSGAQGGFLGCLSTDQFTTTFVPEFVEAALVAEVGLPTEPVESQFGFHVIELVPFDELDLAQIEAVYLESQLTDFQDLLAVAAVDLDAYVDPRYGYYTGELQSLVRPLG